jgi:phenylpropionate dioxygenase-like ring-hydroxylating dioxygenase large terminal subunit
VIEGGHDGWTVVARSEEVAPGPIGRALGGRAIVLFRTGAGGVAALDDSCPHQGNALSDGVVDGSTILCRYHGWSVASDGWCERAASGTRTYAVREADGAVLVRDPAASR